MIQSPPTDDEIRLVKSHMTKYLDRIHNRNTKSRKTTGGRRVFCGRPSKWGNKYTHLPNIPGTELVGSRVEAVVFFRRDLLERLRSGEVGKKKKKKPSIK